MILNLKTVRLIEEKEFTKIYNFEVDRKLEQFSKIYFNKIKLNTNINEL